MSHIIVSIPTMIELNDDAIERVFKHRLEELTEGWYIAKAERQSYRWALCHESEPDHHNGDTYREKEVDLETPGMERIRRAVELKEWLDCKGVRR